jgi:hypothetical protein
VTWTRIEQGGRMVAEVGVVEPRRDSPAKALRVTVHFEAAPPSEKGAVQVTLDAKPFAEVPFIRCTGSDCFGDKQISAADVATLEGAKSLEIQAQNIKVSAPIDNFAEARAGRGKTLAELNAELSEKMKKMAEEANREGERKRAALEERHRKSDEWVKQCIKDKRGDRDVIGYYCVCMSEDMDGHENLSIAQWEKANPAARRYCER